MNNLDSMITRLMAHRFWQYLRLQAGGNSLFRSLMFTNDGTRELIRCALPVTSFGDPALV